MKHPHNKKLASLRGRIGAHSLHAQYDGRDITAKARAAFLGRFEDEVDPERRLLPAEREKRALSARKAYMARLALKSAKTRAARSARREGRRAK